VRAFLAVPSDPRWVESARSLIDRLRKDLPNASWTRPESWHLTLKFFGDVSADFIARFAEAIDPAAFETVPGEIQAGAAVVFPEHGRPRVLGVGFSSSLGVEAVTRLAGAAAEVAARLGSRESRPFHPHVTFARIRNGWPGRAVDDYRREIEAWRFPTWRARSCVLFESRLDPAGAVHTPLKEWSFQGGPRGVRA
jgi:2'-5' RNA ligase